MLIVETIARIRREHFIKGKAIKEIVHDLKVPRTGRHLLRVSRFAGTINLLCSALTGLRTWILQECPAASTTASASTAF
ncbi:MAG: hypothetical protein KGL35_22385 [Bradyrhizobium sp.]|nr:hypothetical protein [Pseudomonadota bacterium]MDE2471401.1 hypothetical protein [Bradyrhizobium sp.]